MKIYPCGKLQRVREAFRGLYAGARQKVQKKTVKGPASEKQGEKIFSEQQKCDTKGKFVFCASNNAHRGPKAMTFGQRQGDDALGIKSLLLEGF